MKQEIFNLDKLIKIRVSNRRMCFQLTYQPYNKKTFWFHGNDEGFYEFLNEKPYTAAELESGVHNNTKYIVEDINVYYRPQVILFFGDNISYTKEFDTYDEALNYGNEIRLKCITNPLIVNF
jgi:hypothetical protein